MTARASLSCAGSVLQALLEAVEAQRPLGPDRPGVPIATEKKQ